MPGYAIHYVSCLPKLLENASFVKGVESPDILKKWFKMGGIELARKNYQNIWEKGMPDFKVFEERIQETESGTLTKGLHYGPSSNPNIIFFWINLSPEEKNNPFYKGYLWHLLTDYAIYKKLNIDAKFSETLKRFENKPSFDILKKNEIARLHKDWDKTNQLVKDTYPNFWLPTEVVNLNVVNFISGEPYYVEWEVLKETIDFLRTLNCLEDPDGTITKVLQFCCK